MIEFLPETEGNAVAIKASGELTHEDYRDTLIPGLESRIARQGRVNVFVEFDEDFEGWNLQSAWDDASFGLSHRSDFNNFAVVGGPAWVRWCLKLSAFLINGEVRFFDPVQREDAVAWING